MVTVSIQESIDSETSYVTKTREELCCALGDAIVACDEQRKILALAEVVDYLISDLCEESNVECHIDFAEAARKVMEHWGQINASVWKRAMEMNATTPPSPSPPSS